MKRYILVFILFSIAGIMYISYSSLWHTNINITAKEHFVSIQDGVFVLNGKVFNPIALNYKIALQANDSELWPCPLQGYNSNDKNRFISKDSSLMELKADMDLIKEMGFNTIRIVGIGELNNNEKKNDEISMGVSIGNDRDTSIVLNNELNYEKYFSALETLFDIIDKANMKVIFLNRIIPYVKSTEEHLKKLATKFKNDSTILAYDLYNEPLYFDTTERNKNEVYEICKRWNKLIKNNDPNHLVTIGLVGILEVMEWDPNILDVDFISFHPYDHERDQVMNEITWYGRYVKKPWMIGETATPADNDSISYEVQKKFANKTMKQAFNCGAIGYSWWQYKDVDWYSFFPNYLGVMNRSGETKTTKENIVVKGTLKPVVQEFKMFNPNFKKDICLCLSNYYNYSQHNEFRLTGKLVNEQDAPIEGGVILAWNQWWSDSYRTITKADGSFELMSSFPLYHWMASATEYSMTRGEILPDTAKKNIDHIPTINLGYLKIDKLSFIH